MDWNKVYKRETRVDWDDLAQTIYSSVTMDDVLSTYAPSTPRKRGRCPCPLHNGKDFNFSYTRNGYKCFVCGESGDVIAFVKDVCELATRADAMKQIANDFRLPFNFGDVITQKQSNKLQELRNAAEQKQKEHDAWWDRYHALMDEWCGLDRLINSQDPAAPVAIARAKQRMAELEYELDNLPPEPR